MGRNTQGLGLLNDIPYYPQSIFYQNHSVITEYMQNDKEVIRLLYHPKMVSGLDEEAVDLVARTIFDYKPYQAVFFRLINREKELLFANMFRFIYKTKPAIETKKICKIKSSNAITQRVNDYNTKIRP